ncbi:hypothetical protein LZ30DRAFT_249125 [Colletotrichum cereale]|nr:hypothetical protein LZ30DRAFT_249125 [Colletotrichum cereale]
MPRVGVMPAGERERRIELLGRRGWNVGRPMRRRIGVARSREVGGETDVEEAGEWACFSYLDCLSFVSRSSRFPDSQWLDVGADSNNCCSQGGAFGVGCTWVPFSLVRACMRCESGGRLTSVSFGLTMRINQLAMASGNAANRKRKTRAVGRTVGGWDGRDEIGRPGAGGSERKERNGLGGASNVERGEGEGQGWMSYEQG